MINPGSTPLASERDFVSWATPRLERLSQRHRAAFAAAVTERQVGTYKYFARKDPRLKPDALRLALDLVWSYAAGESVAVSALNNAKQIIEPLIPDIDAEDAPEQAPLIVDAVSAVFYAVEACLSEDSRNARAAGYCTLDAASTWVHAMLFPSVLKGNDEVRRARQTIDAHPLMIREFQQMKREMDFLENQRQLDKSVCATLRGLCPYGSTSNIGLE